MRFGERHCGKHNKLLMDLKRGLSMHVAVLCWADHPELAETVCSTTLLDLAQMWPAT